MIIIIIAAILPRKVGGEGGKEVVDSPGDDHVVVQTNKALADKVDKAKTFEERREVRVQGDRTLGRILANLQLQEEGGDANDGQHEEVGDKKGPSTILEAQVWKPPHITQPHSISKTRQQEVQLPCPVSTLRVFILLKL